jgi:hypothetical protein
MKYFYADGDNKPVGPLPVEALEDLKAAGIITESTMVIPEGGSEWRAYGDEVPKIRGNIPSPPPPSKKLALRGVHYVGALFIVVLGLFLGFFHVVNDPSGTIEHGVPILIIRKSHPSVRLCFTSVSGVVKMSNSNQKEDPLLDHLVAELEKRGLITTRTY